MSHLESDTVGQLNVVRGFPMRSIKLCENCGSSASEGAIACSQCGQQLPLRDAAIEKVAPWQWLIGFSGRVNRIGFLVREIAGLILIYGIGLPLALSAPILGLVVMALGVVIHISATVRRFHDRGQSGWSFFLLVIPFLNLIFWVMLFVSAGDRNSNEYGQSPNSVEVGI